MISGYLVKNKDCTILELLDCAITPHGCEFLNSVFTPKVGGNLQMIKLDHNPIGSEGMSLIAQGLGHNPEVNVLSLTYCEIGPEGCDGIFEIIIYQNSKLIELALAGNPLLNEGIIKIFQGLACAKTLEMVYLNDCQWWDDYPVLEAMKMAMVNNKTLCRYDLKHNSITDEGIEELCKIVAEAKHVNTIAMSEFISGDAMQMLTDALTANKPAKGGKKGKKKKK